MSEVNVESGHGSVDESCVVHGKVSAGLGASNVIHAHVETGVARARKWSPCRKLVKSWNKWCGYFVCPDVQREISIMWEWTRKLDKYPVNQSITQSVIEGGDIKKEC